MSTITFTSTIDPDVLYWVNDYATRVKKTRRFVLEEALRDHKTKQTKQLLQESLVRAANDINQEELSEWGMEDYNNLVR